MIDELLSTVSSALTAGLLPAVVFFLALTLKHWLLDYFLVSIERTPFKASLTASHPVRAIAHLCYLQGIATVTITFFLFGLSPQLLWLGVLDSLVCLSYYLVRLHNWKKNTFLSCTYIRGIFFAEALRLTLTAIVTMTYFATEGVWTITDDLLFTATLASNLYFDTSIVLQALVKAIIYSYISMFGMSIICSVLQHINRTKELKLQWSPLVAQIALTFLILEQANVQPLFNSAVVATCVASTYYYCRMLLARAQDRRGKRLLEAIFYLLIFALFAGLTTFIYSALAQG